MVIPTRSVANRYFADTPNLGIVPLKESRMTWERRRYWGGGGGGTAVSGAAARGGVGWPGAPGAGGSAWSSAAEPAATSSSDANISVGAWTGASNVLG